MQKQYIQIGNQDVFNGQYLLAVFRVKGDEGITVEDIASEVAAESSTGSNVKIKISTSFSESMNAVVYRVDEEQNLAWIAYPWRIFDRGGNVQNIMTFIAGNVFGMSSVKVCKLLDVYFPPQMLVQYDGPNYTIDDMRRYLGIEKRPIFGTIIKPKIGLTSSEYAEVCYDFWSGGGDFVKNDEPQADQDFAPFEFMVRDVRLAMDRVEEETGKTKVHSFNISSANFDTMIERAGLIQSIMKPNSYAFLVDGITAGWMAVQTVRRRYPDVFLHFHRAGHGAFTREEAPFGFTVPVLTKFARLAGASGIHTGTAGVGKMAGSPKEDIMAANHALRLFSKGDFFNQIWSEIPEKDTDLVDAIKKEQEGEDYSDFGYWRMVKKTAPIISGGLNPTLIGKFLDVIGTQDFITTMGGGVHSHPMGTKAGATAVLQAYEAWKQKVPLEEYAQDKEELRLAIEFYGKKKIESTSEADEDKPVM
jgi:ribulose-bisphosphate carboxylase large chain